MHHMQDLNLSVHDEPSDGHVGSDEKMDGSSGDEGQTQALEQSLTKAPRIGRTKQVLIMVGLPGRGKVLIKGGRDKTSMQGTFQGCLGGWEIII